MFARWRAPGNLGVEFLVPLEWILETQEFKEGEDFMFPQIALLVPSRKESKSPVSFPFKKNLM